MTRLLAIGAIALTLPLLAACTGGPAEGGSSTDPAEPIATVATASADGLDIEDNGDPFCALSAETAPLGQQIADTTGELGTFLPTLLAGDGNAAELNQWGTELIALDEQMVAYFDEGLQYVEGTEGEADFVAMKGFIVDYSLPLANLAASAPNTGAFLDDIATFTTQPEVQAAMTTGPAAAEAVGAYIEERCGSL